MEARRLIIAALLALALPAPAGALGIYQSHDAVGDPVLSASYTEADGPVTWSICPYDGGACVAKAAGYIFEPGDQNFGVSFEATTPGGRRLRSEMWRGRVELLGPPRLAGKARVGETVWPVAGVWRGGWASDYNELQVQACRSPDGVECTTLSAPDHGPYETEAQRRPEVVLSARYLGRYLFAADARVTYGHIQPAIGYSAPEAVPPLTPGPLVALSTGVGPVLAPPTPTPTYAVPTPTPTPARKPTVTLRKRTGKGRGYRVGSVTCPVACSVRLGVRGVLRRKSVTGTVALVLPRGARRPGRPRVTVRVNGIRLASRRVRVT